MTIRGAAIKLSIFIVVTSITAFLTASVVGNIRITPKNSYSAVFTNAEGLRSGDDVKVAGLPIGKIEAVELTGPERVEVTFVVDSERPLTTETFAEIRYKNLISDRYLELTNGSATAPSLPPGSEIPLGRTRSGLQMDELVNGFRPLLEGLEPDAVNRVTAALVDVLNGQSGKIADIVRELGSLSGTLAQKDEAIGRVVDNLELVLSTADQRGQDLSNAIVSLQQLTSGLHSDQAIVTGAVDRLDAATNTLAGVLSEAHAPLTADITKLGETAANLNSRADMLNTLLGQLPHAYQKISRVASYGNFVNFFVCGLAIRYPGPSGGTDTPMVVAPAARCQ